MNHDCRATQKPLTTVEIRRQASIALSVLFVVALVLLSVSAVSASSPRVPPSGQAWLSTGATLAVVRAGGASLYDDGGQVVLELPMGAAVKVIGRTADNAWFYGSTRDGVAGWVSAASVLIFGVRHVPERQGFSGPPGAGKAVAAVSSADDTSLNEAYAVAVTPGTAAASGNQAFATSGSQRLNVRSGPGTAYPIIASVASGTPLTTTARNADAEWIRVEGTDLPGATGWVSARYLTLEGHGQDLPVAASSAAQATPAPAAASLAGKLVFQESSGGRIHVYDLARGSQRTLTTGADPALSPDGQTVAFWRQEGSDYGLYLIDSDGGNERRILERTEKLRAPAWSPDGSKIVFSHVAGEHRCRDAGYNICLPDTFPYDTMFPLKITEKWVLARVDSGGGSYQDLAVIANAISPDWSEHGIFYAALGIQLTQDVSDENQNHLVLSEFRYQDPAAQPGGDRIVLHSLEKDHWEIFTANVDGSNLTALTHPDPLASSVSHHVSPAWSPDGRHIVFLSNRTGEWRLWVMDQDGSNQRALPVDAPITYNQQAEQVVSWGP